MRLAFIFLLLVFSACIRHADEQETVDKDFNIHAAHFSVQTELRHAECFTVTYHGHWKEVAVLDAPGGNRVVHLALLPHGAPVPAKAEQMEVVRIPLQAAASISTTHLPMIDAIGELNYIKAFAAFDYLNNKELMQKLKTANVADIGTGGKAEHEGLLNSGAEVLFSYLFGQDARLKVQGVVNVPVSEYLERSPLGAAEWIKFFALFWNREAEAEVFFKEVETHYNQLVKLAAGVPQKLKVFTGLPWKDQWNMPAGNSSVARLLADAGLDYVYKSKQSAGNLTLSMEEVLNDAIDADVWILVTYFNGNKNIADLTSIDSRFERFAAVRSGNVLLCDLSVSDYFGQAVLRPDLLLGDLLLLVHDMSDGNTEPVFFERLKK